jgi:hypothetical protein
VTPAGDPHELLRQCSRALADLGPRPAGEAAELLALSRSVRQEAETAAALGRQERAVPEAMVFESRGARRLTANVAEVADSFFVTNRRLEHVADALVREARQLEESQVAHDRRRRALQADIDLLRERIRVTER